MVPKDCRWGSAILLGITGRKSDSALAEAIVDFDSPFRNCAAGVPGTVPRMTSLPSPESYRWIIPISFSEQGMRPCRHRFSDTALNQSGSQCSGF